MPTLPVCFPDPYYLDNCSVRNIPSPLSPTPVLLNLPTMFRQNCLSETQIWFDRSLAIRRWSLAPAMI